MASARVTLRHIASYVGVHPSTVSRVLNPEKQSLVSPQIVDRVNLAARELGYYPNRFAHGLKTNQSSTIGIIVSDITNPIFPEMIRGVQNVLMESGYSCVVCSSDQRPERKRRIIEVIRKRQFDGLILLATERIDPLVRACQQDNIPVVLLDRGACPPSIPAVHLNDTSGVKQVMDHLTGLGHKKFAVISGPQRFSGAFSRHRLVIREMTKRQLDITPSLITACNNLSFEEGVRCCGQLIATGDSFTAIVAANDLLAIGCLKTLKRHGIDCPDEISVVGYNDIGLSDKMDPPLTTVKFEQYEPGTMLAQLLLDRLTRTKTPLPYQSVEPTLIVRGSSAAAPASLKTR